MTGSCNCCASCMYIDEDMAAIHPGGQQQPGLVAKLIAELAVVKAVAQESSEQHLEQAAAAAAQLACLQEQLQHERQMHREDLSAVKQELLLISREQEEQQAHSATELGALRRAAARDMVRVQLLERQLHACQSTLVASCKHLHMSQKQLKESRRRLECSLNRLAASAQQLEITSMELRSVALRCSSNSSRGVHHCTDKAAAAAAAEQDKQQQQHDGADKILAGANGAVQDGKDEHEQPMNSSSSSAGKDCKAGHFPATVCLVASSASLHHQPQQQQQQEEKSVAPRKQVSWQEQDVQSILDSSDDDMGVEISEDESACVPPAESAAKHDKRYRRPSVAGPGTPPLKTMEEWQLDAPWGQQHQRDLDELVQKTPWTCSQGMDDYTGEDGIKRLSGDLGTTMEGFRMTSAKWRPTWSV